MKIAFLSKYKDFIRTNFHKKSHFNYTYSSLCVIFRRYLAQLRRFLVDLNHFDCFLCSAAWCGLI